MVTNTIRRGERVYTATLLRRSYREGGKVKKQTLANLSHLPEELIELIRGALRGQRYVVAGEALRVERSLPAGHVEAALVMARRLELARLLDRVPSRERALCLAMIIQRVLAPGSKLAMSRAFAQSTLASELGVDDADEDELYRALDLFQLLVGADDIGCGEFALGDAGAEHVDAVERGLGGDLVLLALEAEGGVADLDLEMLAHPPAVPDLADGEPDRRLAGKRALVNPVLDLAQGALGRGE